MSCGAVLNAWFFHVPYLRQEAAPYYVETVHNLRELWR
jgi:hypothetical protein